MKAMTDSLTYVVDLNDVLDGDLLVISRRHTLELGHDVVPAESDYPPPGEGSHVTIYSGDERMTWDAQVVKEMSYDRFAVLPNWESGREFHEDPGTRKLRLGASDRISLHGADPTDVLRAMLRTPPATD
jgi:hypothetical protein